MVQNDVSFKELALPPQMPMQKRKEERAKQRAEEKKEMEKKTTSDVMHLLNHRQVFVQVSSKNHCTSYFVHF